jgi:uncharacterized protein VirK/YbjX
MLVNLFKSFIADIFSVGVASATMRLARSLRIARRKEYLNFLQSSPAINAHRASVAPHDAFFPVSHRSYLCNYFDENERLLAAHQSYVFADSHFSPTTIAELAKGGRNLWSVECDGLKFEIRLMFGNHNMYEGALSAAFFIEGKHVGVMSFSVVDGTLLGLQSGPQLLLCRNQTTSDRWYQKPLQDAFKHIALPYMLIAAVSGIAESLNIKSIYAITEYGHPHGDEKYVDLMKGSYSGFWEKYNAKPFRKGIVEMALPLESTPLDQVSANHRRRAKGRREVMAQVSVATQKSFAGIVREYALQKQEQAAPSGLPASALVPMALGICELFIRAGDGIVQSLSDSKILALLA